MPVLFPEPANPRTRPLGWIEPAVRWFTESTRAEAVISRTVVNDWYKDFLDPERHFAERLRSELDRDHYQALDELHIHNLLKQHHDDVRYEEGGVGPDFRVYGDGYCVGCVEVLSLFQREDWSAEEQRHWRLADELNRRVPPVDGYFVNFEVEAAKQEPAPRRVAEFVQREIAKLPPHDQFKLPKDPKETDLPGAVYERDGVRIRMTFIPMRADAPTKSDPDGNIVGMGPTIGGFVNSGERLKERVVAKAGGRYAITGVPFVVAVGMHDMVCTDDQVVRGIYGSESIVVATGKLVRQNDGVFGIDGEHPEGRHRRVSAVAVVNRLRVWESDIADVAIYDNPSATYPLPDNLLPGSRRPGQI
jgi:hypothetical protein